MECNFSLLVLALAWLLVIIYFGLEYLFYKTLQRSASVYMLNTYGYDWSFGLVVGTVIIFATLISFFVLNIIYDGQISFNRQVIIGTLLSYVVCVCALNIWGKKYLKRRGIGPNPYFGFRGFLRKCKENIEFEKKKIEEKKKL